jgi:lysophospholipase L1-like esterase
MQIASTLPLAFFLAGIVALSVGAGVASPQDAKTPPATPATSLVPAARSDEWAIKREAELIKRARESAPVNVIFVGDSITQSWEDPGKDVWAKRIAPLGALNLGNSGDRTENVLYRLAQAPLTRLKAKHVVLLIGTNNLGHGTSNAAQTLAGIRAVAEMIESQCNGATIHILEIFPRGEQFHAMRGDVCQINQALRAFVREDAAKHGGKSHYMVNAVGDTFINDDGSISKDIMPDALHLTPKGYDMWADGIISQISK